MECSICGGEIGLLGNRKLEDGNMCKSCAPSSHPGSATAARSTVDEIKEQLDYREANREKVASFRITRTLGERTKVLLDEDAGSLYGHRCQESRGGQPGCAVLFGRDRCKLDIDESRTEIEYEDKDGERKSFNPRRYAYSYDFYIVINVNNPYFNEIRFQLNSRVRGQRRGNAAGRPDAMRKAAGRLRRHEGRLPYLQRGGSALQRGIPTV